MTSPRTSVADRPDLLIFPSLLPISGLALGIVLEFFFPLAAKIDWFQSSVRGLIAVLFFLSGVAFIAGNRLVITRVRTKIDSRLSAPGLVPAWPFSGKRDPMLFGASLVFLGVGLAFRLYWMLLLFPFLPLAWRHRPVLSKGRNLTKKFRIRFRGYKARIGRWFGGWATLGERWILPGMGQGSPAAVVPTSARYELVPLRTRGGTNIVAKFGRALDSRGVPLPETESTPTVLFFYGRRMTIRRDAGVFNYFRRMGANVLIPEFPGYGMSGGRPSERGCYATADAAFEYLTRRTDVDPQRIIVAGWSLGSGTAVELASRKRVAGLFLVGAITSVGDLGRERLPWVFHWLIPSLGARCRFDNLAKIPFVSCPILLVHGTHDPIVPYWMTACLSRAAKATVALRPIVGAEHENVWRIGGKPLWQAVSRWIRETASPDETRTGTALPAAARCFQPQ